MQAKNLSILIVMLTSIVSCSTNQAVDSYTEAGDKKGEIKLITLDPGHFHAALVQKSMYENVDSVVYVFAPEGEDVQEYLKKIDTYNSMPENRTYWREEVYTGADYFQKMLKEKPGNVVVLSGNNKRKTEYIKASVDAGLNVLSDKPMAINGQTFQLLKEVFAEAEKKNVLLYDIMTERFEITARLQREFSMLEELFGELQKGTQDDPAVRKESVHHFFKYVSGSVLKRPAWFFDVEQQGEGIVDVTTHLVDLVQWQCFPDEVIDYESDINITNARHWKTNLTPKQFEQVTHMKQYPQYLEKDVNPDGSLGVFSNGEINYQVKGIHAKVSVIWNFQAPDGAGDTHFSIMKGSKANLIIHQGKEENYKPRLYIEPVNITDIRVFESTLKAALAKMQSRYPGVEVQKSGNRWAVIAPEKYHNGHEAHFGQVTERFLEFLQKNNMPPWEIPNMLAKYYTTTKAVEIASEKVDN